MQEKGQEQEEKRYSDYEKSHPEQLELFNLPVIFDDKRGKYSGTVELYDIIPKYVNSDVEKLRKDGKYLDILSRSFVHRKQDMRLNITPARLLQKDGTTKDFFPSQREEIIEDVLRKFATDPNRNEFLDDRLSVKFTLYEIYKELKKVKHSLSYSEIRESLDILSKTNLEIKSEDNKITFSSNMFETLGTINKNEDSISNNIESEEYNKKVVYFVRFNSLVSDSIKDRSWRIINYEQCMAYHKVISRWLHKRISHMFLINNITIPYNILLSTIIRDSGMARYPKITDNVRQVEECLKEMLKIGSIDKYEIEKIYSKEKKNKLEDAKFMLWVSKSFYDDIQLGNLPFVKLKDIDNNNLSINTANTNENNNIDTDQKYIRFKNELAKSVIMLIDSEKLTYTPTEIKRLINSMKVTEKDINDTYMIDNIIINTKACIEYIKSQNKNNKKYNLAAILTEAIKNNWRLNNEEESRECDSDGGNKQELIDKKIEEFIVSQTSDQKNRKYNNKIKLIFEKFREIFGDAMFQCWIMRLKYSCIKNKMVVFTADNGFIKDYICREILEDKIKRKDGEDILIRKGMKQICRDIIPGLEGVSLVVERMVN